MPVFAKRRCSSTPRAFVNRFFWDGRAASLEEQSLLPVANPAEMAGTTSRMAATLSHSAGYARYFQRAFGDRAITAGEKIPSAPGGRLPFRSKLH